MILVNSKQSSNEKCNDEYISTSNLKDTLTIIKPIIQFQNKHLAIIDESIIQKLGIYDNLITFVEQELTDDGILMRIKKL
jgi:hypothetical protein